jgi:hypothetical protein
MIIKIIRTGMIYDQHNICLYMVIYKISPGEGSVTLVPALAPLMLSIN